MRMRYLLFLIAFFSIVGWGPFSFLPGSTNSEIIGSSAWLDKQTRALNWQAGNINPYVLKLGLTAYAKARQRGWDQKGLLTIIDYSKPSTERRLWVFDLNRNKVLFNTWVAHGRNSGKVNATSFSNQTGSLKSSIGVFLTANSYMGGNGYSLRVQGLERGINDNALHRSVVIHGAWYASESVAKKYGFLGRSWGCPAVSQELAKPIIDTIKDKTVVMAYYPDRYWLNHSTYLAG